jgi:tetratricopeptide (TPR) repeat protein
MGEAHRAKGDLAEADTAWTAALRYAANDARLRGKILFVLADLRERQKAHDEAIERWNAYEAFAKDEKQSKAFPATAADRKQRASVWKKLVTDYAEVKQRIERRLKEADEKARQDATKGAR